MNKIQFSWIHDESNLEIIFENDQPVLEQFLNITDHLGHTVDFNNFHQKDDRVYIRSNEALDFSKNYRVTYRRRGRYAYFSQNLLNHHFYYEGMLGAEYSKEKVEFALWSPPAVTVELMVYDKNNPEKVIFTKRMKRKEHGVWKETLAPKELMVDDLHGYYYLYRVEALGKTKIALDPYAKSLSSFAPHHQFVKGAIIDFSRTNPTGYKKSRKLNKDLINSPTEMIGYEVHVRDFTIDPDLDVDPKIKGTYEGFMTRVPYLKELGISHVQFLPLQSFYTVDEETKTFQDDKVDPEMINYNWGYDPHHYFSPEGWYSVNPKDPALRIKELKALVKELHDSNIGAILDVVYNHVYKQGTFVNVAPGCYLRRNYKGDISTGTGAGVSLESRNLMTRRLIIDSLKHFVDEYHFNGFRFDLMGFLDRETMIEVRKTLGDDIILYGEAWEFTDLPDIEATTKSNIPDGTRIGAFSDTTRDSISGAMQGKGFIQSAHYEGPKVRAGLIGNIRYYNPDYNGDGKPDAFISTDSYQRFAEQPENTINFLTIHDGFTLWDKLNLSVHAPQKARKRLQKMALAMLFTSQGRIVLHGGVEAARSKPLAKNDPNKHRAHTSKDVNTEKGVRHFHENSYRSPDVTNMFDWSRTETFKDIVSYVQGLSKMRRNLPALRYRSSENIQKGFRFVAESMPDTPKYEVKPASLYHSWDDVDSLKIQFQNGPRNSRYYLVGEVIDRSMTSKNPDVNPFSIDFDEHGYGFIEFKREQIRSFDMGAWSDADNLQFKLVKDPGKWTVPQGAYTPMGYNMVRLSSIRFGNVATVDLMIPDHVAGEGHVKHHGHIAYFLDNTLEENGSEYNRLLVIHNAEDHSIDLDVPELHDLEKCHVLMDGNAAGVDPLVGSEVFVRGKTVHIPSKTSTVLGCKE